MKKIRQKFLQDIFDATVDHFEFLVKERHCDFSFADFIPYLEGALYALSIAFGLDYDSCILISKFFEQKTDEYFGGKESE